MLTSAARLLARRLMIVLPLSLFLAWPSRALAEGQTFPLVPYWEDDKQEVVYDFGARSTVAGGKVQTPAVWMISDGLDAAGAPKPVAGQRPIFDVRPGEPGYSDLWRVVVSDAYPPIISCSQFVRGITMR